MVSAVWEVQSNQLKLVSETAWRSGRSIQGLAAGITSLTTPDGCFSIMMPHPERVFRAVQNSWYPKEWNENGAWLRMFQNARKWVG